MPRVPASPELDTLLTYIGSDVTSDRALEVVQRVTFGPNRNYIDTPRAGIVTLVPQSNADDCLRLVHLLLDSAKGAAESRIDELSAHLILYHLRACTDPRAESFGWGRMGDALERNLRDGHVRSEFYMRVGAGQARGPIWAQ